MPGGYSIIDTLLLIGAGFIAVGGVMALLLARPRTARLLPVPHAEKLSEPTRAVIGVACVVAAYHFAAPVFGWSGLRGPMGAIAALAVVAVIGSIWMDVLHHRAEPHEGDES